jgi:parallel beta-helix repeat protein
VSRKLIPFMVMLIAAFYGWREFSNGRWTFGPTPPPVQVATLVVRSNLAASVLVNGQSRGVVTKTSPVKLELDPGTYTVRLVSQITDPHEFQITLGAGERLERQVTLALRISGNLADVRVRTNDELVRAVAVARTGAKITLEAGEYLLPQGLELKKPVTLIGQGRDNTRVVSEAGRFVVKFDSWGVFAVRGIRFEHRGRQPSDVLVVEKGTIEIDACQFTGAVRNAGQQANFGDGLWVRGIVLGTVKDSVFDNNGLHGLELQEKARLTLQGNTFERNTQNGLSFFGESGGEARGNTSRLNGLHGISVNEDALVTVLNNTLEQNTEVGLRYSGNAWGTASGNIIRDNKLSGIAINDRARPTLIANTSTGNGSYGLYVAQTARALIGAGNVFRNNAKGDVQDLRKPVTRP